MPPLGEERPDNPVNEGGDSIDEGGSAPVCACDTTWACSEGCECDPECIEGKSDDGGCNSAGTSSGGSSRCSVLCSLVSVAVVSIHDCGGPPVTAASSIS